MFDQNGKRGTTNNIPIRYASNTTNYWNTDNIPQCPTNEVKTTDDSLNPNPIYGDHITGQVSCEPNTLNAGNWYNHPAATAGFDLGDREYVDAPNSICPKGWQLPPNDDNSNETKKSYNNLIRTAYNISSTTSNSEILISPLSFIGLGAYSPNYGSLNARGSDGNYWTNSVYSSVFTRHLYFTSELLVPQSGDDRAFGFSIRCVSR